MSTPALILLADYSGSAKELVGERAYSQGRLHEQEIPVPRSFCVTENALQSIAKVNNLKNKIDKALPANISSETQKSRAKNNFLKIFATLKVPRDIASEMVGLYRQYLWEDYVHIMPSNSPNYSSEWVHDNVRGEANVIESILQVWGRLVFANSMHSAKNTPLHTRLFSSPIMVEWAPQAEASGVAFTKDPETGSKTEVTIYGVPGIFHPQKSEQHDVYKVDVRTWNLVSQQIATKKQAFARGDESLAVVKVPGSIANQPVLERGEAENLARLVFKIKQQSLQQQKVHWLIINHQLLITAIEPVAEFEFEHPAANHPEMAKKPGIKYLTALYISAGNPDKAGEQVQEIIDGVGLLRSEYAIAKFGLHPQHVLKSKKHTALLKEELIKTIQTYRQHLNGRPLIYRSQNFTSAELLTLKFASNYEPNEPNPYLGYRGGLKIAAQSELFNFELDAILEVMSQTGQAPFGLMVPFIRTPGELRTAIDLIAKKGLLHKSHFQVWLQLNTPENIYNLSAYPLNQVAGVSLNARSLHGLLSGIDPDNAEMLSRYPLPANLLLNLIKQVTDKLQESGDYHSTKVFLHLENFNAYLAAEAIKLGINGLIVKPQVARLAQECIIDTERTQIIS